MIALRVTLLASAFLALAGSADACLQVYPYSELCDGDVRGFLEALLP